MSQRQDSQESDAQSRSSVYELAKSIVGSITSLVDLTWTPSADAEEQESNHSDQGLGHSSAIFDVLSKRDQAKTRLLAHMASSTSTASLPSNDMDTTSHLAEADRLLQEYKNIMHEIYRVMQCIMTGERISCRVILTLGI
jgi:hypothetical protein